jgi:hypothetical protein
MHALVTLQPQVALGLVGRKIVERRRDFALRLIGDDLAHEVEEFDAPPSESRQADASHSAPAITPKLRVRPAANPSR